MSVTKRETRVVFDPDKIGIGDVISFDLRLPGGFLGLGIKQTRVVGIVTEVKQRSLTVVGPDFDGTSDWLLSLEDGEDRDADSITVLRRNPLMNGGDRRMSELLIRETRRLREEVETLQWRLEAHQRRVADLEVLVETQQQSLKHAEARIIELDGRRHPW